MMGALLVDDTDLYTWQNELLDLGELWEQTQINIDQWSNLLKATDGALKPVKCFWYVINYKCIDGEWVYTDSCPQELRITNVDGSDSTIHLEPFTSLKKTLGVFDSPAGGNMAHLAYIKEKASTWINRMRNGHLPSHIAWVAYNVGTLPDGYHKLNPLPQVPPKQSVPTNKVCLPPYFGLPIGIPKLRKIVGPTVARAQIPW
jgi:hypothetical protein